MFLKRKKIQAFLTFVKSLNLITSEKIKNLKITSFNKIWEYSEKVYLYNSINKLNENIIYLFKKNIFKTISDNLNNKIARNKLRGLFRGYITAFVLSEAMEYDHYEKIKYLITVTMHQKEIAKQNYLKIIIRGWRFIALADSCLKKKMEDFNNNLKGMYDELLDKMLDKDNISLPKDLQTENNNPQPIKRFNDSKLASSAYNKKIKNFAANDHKNNFENENLLNNNDSLILDDERYSTSMNTPYKKRGYLDDSVSDYSNGKIWKK